MSGPEHKFAARLVGHAEFASYLGIGKSERVTPHFADAEHVVPCARPDAQMVHDLVSNLRCRSNSALSTAMNSTGKNEAVET